MNCIKSTGKIFGDPTSGFIAPSISGNNYIIIIYNYDINTIQPIAIPSRTKEALVTTYKIITSLLQSRDMTQKVATLDNETSELLLTSFEPSDISINLVTPNLHRRNTAEIAIQSFKTHFISLLCGTDPKFPINLWVRCYLKRILRQIYFVLHTYALLCLLIVEYGVISITIKLPLSRLVLNF